jgi:CheY-like chemotaxis protein
LLAFSRKQTLRPEILDLRDTLSDLTHLLNRLVGEQVSLTLDHAPGLSAIRADKRQFEQVVMNLVVNARDAMPDGGEIRIVTRNRTIKTALSRDRAQIAPGNYVSVEVIDTGQGIAKDKLEHVFEPFFTTKNVGKGTGLGLSTAYGIVKQTGGFIFVDSVEHEGTTFQLLFPAHDHAVEIAPTRVESRVRGPSSGGVVLLVEDEVPVRAFASRALQLRGFTVIEAGSAEEALELLQDQSCHVDVFVTDVVMPGMDGPSWVKKALARRPEVRVVFISGYAEETVGDSRSRIAHAVFLPKPFSLDELAATVERMAAKRRSRRVVGAIRFDAGVKRKIRGTCPVQKIACTGPETNGAIWRAIGWLGCDDHPEALREKPLQRALVLVSKEMRHPRAVPLWFEKFRLTADPGKIRWFGIAIGLDEGVEIHAVGAVGMTAERIAAAITIPASEPVRRFAHDCDDRYIRSHEALHHLPEKPVVAEHGRMLEFGWRADDKRGVLGQGTRICRAAGLGHRQKHEFLPCKDQHDGTFTAPGGG